MSATSTSGPKQYLEDLSKLNVISVVLIAKMEWHIPKRRKSYLHISDRNLVPEELDLVDGFGFSCWVSSCNILVPGLVPGLNF